MYIYTHIYVYIPIYLYIYMYIYIWRYAEAACAEDVDVLRHDGTVVGTLLLLVSVTLRIATKSLCPCPRVLVTMRCPYNPSM